MSRILPVLKTPLRAVDSLRLWVKGLRAPPERVIGSHEREVQMEGHFHLEVRERGKKVTSRMGKNICTLTGREFLLQRAVLLATTPTRAELRSDCLRYVGFGTGAQPEVSGVTSLVAPTPYAGGQFLAPLDLPTWVTGTDGTGSALEVQLSRTFSEGELSLGATVILTEAGLFSDGDPTDDWAVGSTPTSLAAAGSRAPFFYKAFEPLPKTTGRTVRLVWSIRHL